MPPTQNSEEPYFATSRKPPATAAACVRSLLGGGLLDGGHRGVARLLRGLQALVGGGEVALELCAQALFGVERRLGAAVLELGGPPGVALLLKLRLERRARRAPRAGEQLPRGRPRA